MLIRFALLGVLLAPAVALAGVQVDVDVNVEVVEPSPELTAPVVVASPPRLVGPAIAPPPPPPARNALQRDHWEVEVALEGAGEGFVLGDLKGSQHGVRAAVGRQVGPVRLTFEYGVGSFSARLPIDTTEGSVSGHLQLDGQLRRLGAAARYRSSSGSAGSAIGFYGEAGLGRQTIAVSFEGAMGEATRLDGVLGLGLELAGGRHRMAGVDAGLRLVASRRPDGAVEGTHDLAVLFQIGVLLGS